jgi:enoyl-CoA hydratase/carnithine racemase
MSVSSNMLEYRVSDRIAWLALNRPEVNNAITQSFYGELVGALTAADADPEVGAVILHGAGDSFCAGGDIKDFGSMGSDLASRQAYMDDAMAAFRAVQECTKPVIAAVHGFVLGGGCELTLVCDIVIADETARFGLPEARVGLVPGPGAAVGLTQVNLHWMKLMVLGAEMLDAHEAQLAGLATRVVPPGEHVAAAESLARRMASLAPLSLSVGKRLLNQLAGEHFELAKATVIELQGTNDFREGIAAFTERRPAAFTGS